MTPHLRLVAVAVLSGATMTGLVLAQGAQPAPQGQAPTAQPPAQQPPAGRGGERGQAPGRGGGRRGGFTQYTRELAPQDVIVRGKSLYEANCASCHAVDLRGGQNASNLLRSGTALNDQRGELIGAAIEKHSPAITLVNADAVAIAEYIHSVHASMGGQGSPPGRNPTNVELNVLVGDAKAGEALFGAACAKCHSVGGDLKGVGAKYADARALQNAWVAGSAGRFGGGGRGGGGGVGNPATVTLADGSKVEGTLERLTSWLVAVRLPDGTRKSFPRDPNTELPRVDVKDPQDPHKKMVLELDDPENKKMHDITVYLSTVK